ncbi:putative Protein of unknown function (DUF2009) [Trypanosoma cruzi]|uniref:Non-canonical E2 ubiquitin-conjugating enzyme C-terminal domain-containing protein n=2 Tax=Trypanosoma cruzi TaxID=5693 RepID=Q4E4V2_TRYCC|nr:hypothetical protein, conserved [Trypanosoma cruzi]EAN99756.1 hypothetical protein, conserved [Trypanosoma cruzi]KAF5225545.1 putative Protein of unknown function (DUF2009) [Trypanosoma cruzi]KAF8298545.1 putative Protein of unknown function (DUF2009) [Trypanosoma cruzi]|eukprot:XP_821607.1 hypothetical protein [Trypanosoma cruzi strain CL Brener]
MSYLLAPFCGLEKSETMAEYELMPEPIQNADYIPLRLNPRERKIQRLMRAVIMASHYTDKVDNEAVLKSNKRDAIIVKEITNSLSGLITGLDVEKGAKLLREKDFSPFAREIQLAVEASRRYKMMNPDFLRTDYVKFLYMVQDAVQNENVREMLGFVVAEQIVTVGFYCRALGFESILQDNRMPLCITPVPFIKNRNKLNKALRHKDVTVNGLLKEYSRASGRTLDEVEIAVRSLNDANHFANDNVDSTNQMLHLLKEFFSPDAPTDLTNLSIEEGENGSRLSHNHRRQYFFVLQSLSLWKNICRRMFSLWTIAEGDMLNPNEPYEFRYTGQGYQRVQKAPNLYRAISEVVQQTKDELGEWVGSDRIHLGDDQVPNAFHFIDKYAQVSRIIIPILRTIAHIDTLAESYEHNAYMKEVWDGSMNAKRAILRDFFRHGFDGSGGDNMDDAGSCVDGRLTSAWNWCNNIRWKPFYPLFLLAGFSSFDGELGL